MSGPNLVARDFKIVRSDECARSRQHRGVFTRVIHECAELQILRTEMEALSSCEHADLGHTPAYHFVVEGNPVFQAPSKSAQLMPGDSIILSCNKPCAVVNSSTSRSVILSVLFKSLPKGTEP